MKFELEAFHRNTPGQELAADVKRAAKRMRKDYENLETLCSRCNIEKSGLG